MNFAFDEEQEELRAMARAFLADHSGSEAVRAAMESELGYDPGVWKQIAQELGWAAITVPEACDGLGLGAVELSALLECTGEALLCSPFFSTVCLGANALLVAGTEDQQTELLPAIAAGERTATLAGLGAEPVAAGLSFRADGDDYVLAGRADQVVDGHSADLLILAARDADGRTGLFFADGSAAGVSRRALPTMDQTRRLAAVELDDLRLPASACLATDAARALQQIVDRACVALAAEQVGGAQRCLDLAVAYAKEREQFGRPIGSFQAIKHKAADMMIELESARSAAYYAACIADEGGDELASVASLAKAYCSDTYFRCAADCLQIHGGVGFTWEYDVHLYFKRARATEQLLGAPSWHRERVAQEIGL